MKYILSLLLSCNLFVSSLFITNDSVTVSAENNVNINLSCESAILMEASTGAVIYQYNEKERKSPASITKIMTLLLAMEALKEGKVHLSDLVVVSEYASSMGGSQVFLAEGEEQSFETMLKCIAVSSGNDASVAVAEYISGSEEAFVEKMNQKAKDLGMENTHFEDCCGLSNSDNHYTSAQDVAIMSRELINNYPEIYNYTQIWMEDITHVTKQGESTFTLSSTNKLLKQYPYTTGLKTGSTNKAKYCFCATAQKDGMDLIAVIMGAPTPKDRFKEARELLTYGFSKCHIYIDENHDLLPEVKVQRGNMDNVQVVYQKAFRYLDMNANATGKIKKEIILEEKVSAPVEKGQNMGYACYYLDNVEIGRVPILSVTEVKKADLKCYFIKILHEFLL